MLFLVFLQAEKNDLNMYLMLLYISAAAILLLAISMWRGINRDYEKKEGEKHDDGQEKKD